MPIRRFVALPALLAMLVSSHCLRAQAPTAPPSTGPIVPDTFMRFVEDEKGGGSFQTAEVTFENVAGVEVHLIAAVHIGEKGYYDRLNDHFKSFDAVLYEVPICKSKEHRNPRARRSRHAAFHQRRRRFPAIAEKRPRVGLPAR